MMDRIKEKVAEMDRKRAEVNEARKEQDAERARLFVQQKEAEATRTKEAQEQRAARRVAAYEQLSVTCPLPLDPRPVQLPGGLRVFEDEFLVSIGKDYGWSSQRITLTSHRLIHTHGRATKDQESVYLTDIRDIIYHRAALSRAILVVETAGGHSITGLPAAKNGAQLRNQLLSLVHWARSRPQESAQSPAPAVAIAPDKYAQLQKIGELRDAGILTAEEFNQEKRRILNGGSNKGEC